MWCPKARAAAEEWGEGGCNSHYSAWEAVLGPEPTARDEAMVEGLAWALKGMRLGYLPPSS